MAKTEPLAKIAGELDVWRASWVWTGEEGRTKNAYIYARKTFELTEVPKNAKLYCSADSRYRLYVNGNYVGQGPVPSTPGTTYYDSYDVTAFLQEGENCIALLVHYIGEGTYSYVPAKAGFICQLNADDMVIASDESWKILQSPDWTDLGQRISKRLGFQEVFDSRLSPGDWPLPDFYDEQWEMAAVVGPANSLPWGRFVPREVPHRVEEFVTPKAVVGAFVCPQLPEDVDVADMAGFMAREELTPLPKRGAHGLTGFVKSRGPGPVVHPPRSAGVTVILDFGREVTGQVELSISGWGGTIIDIGYSERLEDGRVKPDRARMRYTDRYIMRSGRQSWRSLGERAFRYMQIDFRESPRAVGIDYVRVIQKTQGEGQGKFDCSDKQLKEIWNTGAYTARLCMQDMFIVCPWRERAQWWGDARLISHVGYYTTGDVSLLKQGIRQIAASQRPDGSVLGVYPAAIERLIPDYSALWILSVWEYYAWTHDREFLAEIYPAVVRCLEWFGRFAGRDGLLSDVDGDLFIDWAEIEKRGVVTAINCLYYEALHRTSLMATALENTEDHDRFGALASTVRFAINRYLWSVKRGLYIDSRWDSTPEKFSAQTNILAVLFDIPDHYRKIAICRQLLNEEWLDKLATPYFTSYFVEILCRTGFYQEALDMIRKRWGGMIEQGATTFWERFTQDYDLCHGWSSGPTRHLSAEYLGVRPVAGERKVRIAPQPADLKWAKGLVPTPYGNVEVDWKMDRRRFTVRVRVADGLTAELIAPNATGAKVMLDGYPHGERLIQVGSGEHELRVDYPIERKVKEPKKGAQQQESSVEILPVGESLRGDRRGRRPLRRREKPAAAAAEPIVIEGLEEVPPVVAEPTAVVEEPKQKSRQRARGRRRRGEKPVEAQPVETTAGLPETASIEAAAKEVVAAEVAAEAVAAPVEEAVKPEREKKPRRRTTRRKPKTEAAAEAPAGAAAEAVAEHPEPIVVEIPPVEAVETEVQQPALEQKAEAVKKPRRRTTRKKPAAAETPKDQSIVVAVDVVQPEVVQESAAVSDEVAPAAEVQPERPKRQPRRRTTRTTRKKAAEPENTEAQSAVEAVSVPAAVETAPVTAEPVASESADEAKPKKRVVRRRRKPKAAPESDEGGATPEASERTEEA